MDNKPTISYSCLKNGDENLILTLSTHLRSLLLDHVVTWERSYGRAPRKILLDAKLLPITSALLSRTDLVTRPYFHIFWTECNDIDNYRAHAKEEISSWIAELAKYGCTDWMIIYVSGEGVSKSSKSKLQLTRGSMSDRLRSDFSPKQHDRVHTLQDPLKESTKSSESWSALCSKLVSFAVTSIDKAVSSYEDKVRTERERRNEHSWNFCSYFVLQEELAFMFEMLRMYDEALVQYDELDAMFTQYIINAQAGDIAHWLSSFSNPITQWHPLSLWRKVDGEARQNIVQCKATIIDIRNYLFSRHCHLLIRSGMLNNVTERMYVFLHSLETEIDILEIILPQGATECWLFMSCLELAQTLKRKSDEVGTPRENEELESNPMSYDQLALEMANLWDLARRKLLKLGDLCGLLPNTTPSSKQLNHVVDLIAGIGDDEDRGDDFKLPAAILRECLSSESNFYRQYLELCEQAIGIYKHTGRFRTARSIGGELAQFYMLADKPQKAESFMIDCVKMYSMEGWQLLASKASENLANCSKYLCKIRRYLRICCSLMCDKFIPMDRRINYLNEISNNSTDIGAFPLAIMLSVFSDVNYIKFSPAKTQYHINDEQYIYICVTSTAPAPIKFQSLQISLRRIGTTNDAHSNHAISEVKLENLDEDIFSEEDSNAMITSFSKRTLDTPKKPKKSRYISSCSFDGIAGLHHTNKLNKDGKIELISMDNSIYVGPIDSKHTMFPDVVNLCQESEIEVDTNIIKYTSITCRQSQQLLKRQDSCQSAHSLQFGATNIVMDSYEECLETKNVLLKPGENIIKVNVNTELPGEYALTQLRFAINKVYFVLPRILPNISYIVNKQMPRVETRSDDEKTLTCGIRNEAEIIIKNGDYPVTSDTPMLKITTKAKLNIEKNFVCVVQNKNGDILSENSSTASYSNNTWSLKLPECPVLSSIILKFMCKLDLPEIDENEEGHRHKRSHSAPNIQKIEDNLNSIHEENADTLQEKTAASPPTKQLMPAVMPIEKDSPVKKFLSFMREVAGDHKRENMEPINLSRMGTNSTPVIEVQDDLIEVTLEDDKFERNETFPRLPKKPLLSGNFPFMGHRKTRSDVSSSTFSMDSLQINLSEENSRSQSVSTSPALIKKSPIITLPRTPPDEVYEKQENEQSDEEQDIICPITVTFPWPDTSEVTRNLRFKWPIEFSHKMHNCCVPGERLSNPRLICVTIKNISAQKLAFRKPQLKFTKLKHLFVNSFTDESEEFEILTNEEVNFIWRITSGTEMKPTSHLDICTTMQMNTLADDMWTDVSYNFQVENIKTLYVISTKIGGGKPIECGVTTSIEILVERLREDPDHNADSGKYQMLMFKVVDTRGQWAVCERSSGLISMPPAQLSDSENNPVTSRTSLEIMPLVDGYLHPPQVQIYRYYKRDSSEYDEELSSTDSPVLKPPRLKEFNTGEVINVDCAMQVNVVQPTVTNLEPKASMRKVQSEPVVAF